MRAWINNFFFFRIKNSGITVSYRNILTIRHCRKLANVDHVGWITLSLDDSKALFSCAFHREDKVMSIIIIIIIWMDYYYYYYLDGSCIVPNLLTNIHKRY